MKNRKIGYLMTVLLMLAFAQIQAQSSPAPCGTDEMHEHLLATDPDYAAKRDAIEAHRALTTATESAFTGTVIIPVVWNVVSKNASEEFTDSEILDALNRLNDDFRKRNADTTSIRPAFAGIAADMNIEFRMARFDPSGNPTSGIRRRTTTESGFFSSGDPVKFNSTGGLDAWPTDQYLNIWICDLLTTPGFELFGYAQFPGGVASTDGVVIDYNTMPGGAFGQANNGRILTHEVGHWLDLYHTFQGGCSTSGDLVADTPSQDGNPNFTCPSSRVSCGSEDNNENYMNYTDNYCQHMFTEGQKTRARALFAAGGERESLLLSPALYPCGTRYCETLSFLSFNGYISQINANGVVVSSGYDVYRHWGANNTVQFEIGGSSYPIIVSQSPIILPTGQTLQIWIDLNQDGDFDDADELRAVTTVLLTGIAFVDIPNDALPGTTSMRVRLTDGTSGPCDISFGDTEDFCVEILPPCGTACTVSGSSSLEWIDQVDFAGAFTNTSGDDGSYANYGLSNSATLAQGDLFTLTGTAGYASTIYSESWKVYMDFNKDGDFDEANELVAQGSGTNAVTMNGQIPFDAAIGETTMRVLMTFSSSFNGCSTGYEGEIEDYCVTITELDCGTYCTTSSSSTVEWIEEIRIGDFQNTSGNDGNYLDFGYTGAEFAKGTSYSMELNPGYSSTNYSEYWAVWMDFNRDGDFDDAGEQLFNTPSSIPNTVNGNITIPSTATNGPVTMRVMMNFNSISSSCGTFSFGEVEDYCVVIIDAPACDASTAPTGLTSVVSGSNVTLSWNAVPNSLGCQIQGGPVGSFAGSIIRPGANQHTYSFPVLPGTYNWRIACACQISPLVVTPPSLPDTFTVFSARESELAEAVREMSELQLRPNPTTGPLNAQLNVSEAGDYLLSVVDILGRTVHTESVNLGEGANSITIDLPALSAGTYVLNLNNGSAHYTERFEFIK